MISVVQPAYHCLPNGGHGNFSPAASRRFNCDLVFATRVPNQFLRVYHNLRGPLSFEVDRFGGEVGSLRRTFGGICDGYRVPVSQRGDSRGSKQGIPISTAPAVEPARTDRIALGVCFFSGGAEPWGAEAVAMVGAESVWSWMTFWVEIVGDGNDNISSPNRWLTGRRGRLVPISLERGWSYTV